VKRTKYEFPHYVVFSNRHPLPSSWVQVQLPTRLYVATAMSAVQHSDKS